MHGVPVPHTRPWGRLGIAIVVVVVVFFISASGTGERKTVTASRLQADLNAARSELSMRIEELKRVKEVLESKKQDMATMQSRLSELEAEHKTAHSKMQAPHAEHTGMQTRDPKRMVLHPKLGRNEINKWSDMKLDRQAVRAFARVEDSHICRAHSWAPFYNNSDPFCTIDVSKHLDSIPLNVTILPKEFDIFHYVPNCPSLFGRQICDLEQAFPRLEELIAQRARQQPLDAPPALTQQRDASQVHLAYFIQVHRSDFLLVNSVEALEKLIRRILHPNDVIVLHVDRGSGGMFAEVCAAMIIAENFTTSVREFLQAECISPGGALQTQVQLEGFSRLLEISNDWDHVIYLSGLDFPLRTRNELVAYLQPGMSYFTLQALGGDDLMSAFEQYWAGWYIDCPNPTGNNRFRLAERLVVPGLSYSHSDNVYALSRELATWITKDEYARLLWLYFRTTNHPQEYYLPTAVASDKQFLNRVTRKSIILFEADRSAKSLPLHSSRNFKNTTADQTLIQKAHQSGEFFFVHRPRPQLYKFIDTLRDPTFTNTDPPPAKGHEH